MTNTEINTEDSQTKEESYQPTEIAAMTEEDFESEYQRAKSNGNQENPSEPKKEEKVLTPEDRIAALEKQISDLEKIKNDRGNYIDKQKDTISSYKSKIESLTQKLNDLNSKTTSESFWEDPEKALSAREEKAKVQQELNTTEIEFQKKATESKILNSVPNYLDMIDDIIDYLRDEDPYLKEEDVKFYKENPFSIDPNAAINFSNLAKAHKRIKLLESKVGQKNKPINDRVKDASAFKTSVATLGSSIEPELNISSNNLARMSDDDFEMMYKSLKNKR